MPYFYCLSYVGPPNRNQSHQPRRFSVSCNGKCLGGFIASDCESTLRQLSEHIFCALPVMYWTDFLPVHALEQQQFATKEEMRLASRVERKRESRGGRVFEKFQNLRPPTLSRLQRAGWTPTPTTTTPRTQPSQMKVHTDRKKSRFIW